MAAADMSVIDSFTTTFTTYIDSGFGLLSPDMAFLTNILIGIDITLAGLFWAMDTSSDVIASLLKKILYVGFFAFLIGNYQFLATAIFDSFAAIGLKASGSPLTAADLMKPGFVASAGFTAAHPLLDQIGALVGFTTFFDHFPEIFVLCLSWLIVLLAFFILAIQLFIAIIEFKLTTLAGFILVPFALFKHTSFLAERVLGLVMASGIKLMVLAVIVGIGSTIFGTITTGFTPPNVTLAQAASTMLAALAMLGLGLFGPGIAAGLMSGAPQLGAGAAAATVAGATAAGVAAGSLASGSVRAATGAVGAGTRAAASTAGNASLAYGLGHAASGQSGWRGAAAGLGGVARAGMGAISAPFRRAGAAIGSAFRSGGSSAWQNTGGSPIGGGVSDVQASNQPEWARKIARRQRLHSATSTAIHTLRHGDHGGGADSPKLSGGE
jgi:type IV secretion system protein TrbL